METITLIKLGLLIAVVSAVLLYEWRHTFRSLKP